MSNFYWAVLRKDTSASRFTPPF